MTRLPSLPEQTHTLLKPLIKNGDIVIDATCGNGYDSLFLAELVAPRGLVYGFDIQQAAINVSFKRLQQADLENNVKLIHIGHELMRESIAKKHHGNIKAVMFNLGYLPRANKQIITHSETTLIALNTAISLLAPSATITVLAYPGHKGGDIEMYAVELWCQQLGATFKVKIINSPQHIASSPRLFVIQKTIKLFI